MAEIRNGGRLVQIELSQADIDAIHDSEVVTVECPHTGETIYLTIGSVPREEECECCGQTIAIENPITPSMRGPLSSIESGSTAIYETAHTAGDITIVIRADWEVTDGWN